LRESGSDSTTRVERAARSNSVSSLYGRALATIRKPTSLLVCSDWKASRKEVPSSAVLALYQEPPRATRGPGESSALRSSLVIRMLLRMQAENGLSPFRDAARHMVDAVSVRPVQRAGIAYADQRHRGTGILLPVVPARLIVTNGHAERVVEIVGVKVNEDALFCFSEEK